jgi:hemerythrin-like metal-binding protein
MSSESCPFPIAIIDEEHRGIQRGIVNLMEAILLGAGAAKVLETAQEALRITRLHFEHEEAILNSINFPKLKQHAEDHCNIAETLERVAEELKSKESAAALRSLREYRRLLLVHLQTEDEHYREDVNRYAAQLGVSPLPPRIRHAVPER